jgi:hypothetical protein
MDTNIIISLVIFLVIIASVYYYYSKNQVKEGFLGNLPSMTINKQTIADQTTGVNKGSFFSVPGNFQSMVSPRFSNVDYGAQITYNLPSIQNQAVPRNPLALGNMATEGYRGPASNSSAINKSISGSSIKGGNRTKENFPSTCGLGGTETIVRGNSTFTSPDYAAGDYNDVRNTAYSSGFHASDTGIPVGDMTTVDPLGNQEQSIVYDRLIVANRNSNLRAQGDKIRGDLAIAPLATGWFRPSVSPVVDLEPGAMNVIGGSHNETSNQLSQLLYKSSGNSITTFGGVNMSNQLSQTNTAGYGDVNTVVFP